MLSPKYVELIERLSVGTERGEVKWDQTVNDRMFITYFRGFSLSLGMLSTPPLGDRIKVTLRNESGKSIDSFTVDEKHDQWSTLAKLYSEIHEIYSLVRRQAREAEARAHETDAAVEEVLNQLRLAS